MIQVERSREADRNDRHRTGHRHQDSSESTRGCRSSTAQENNREAAGGLHAPNREARIAFTVGELESNALVLTEETFAVDQKEEIAVFLPGLGCI